MNDGLFRGDHKEPEKRKPIPTKIIAGMLETAGTSQVNYQDRKVYIEVRLPLKIYVFNPPPIY